MRKFAIACALYLLTCSTGWAATHYVNNSGTPACADVSTNGTLAAPWCTLSYGLTQIAGGDTLYLMNGTYNGDFVVTGPSGTPSAHTVISSAPGQANVVLSGSGLGSGRFKISHGCSYMDLVGVTITNLNQGLYLDDDAGTSVACTNITVDGITVHDVGQEGIAVREGSGTFALNDVIKNSTIYNTGRIGPSQNGEGIYTGNSSGVDNTNHVTILNNTIHDTQDECIELKGDSHDITLNGNTMYHCENPGSQYSCGGGNIEVDEPRNTSTNPNHIIKNNIIHDALFNAGCTKHAIRLGTGATVFNNVIYNIDSNYTCIEANTAFGTGGTNFPHLVYHNTVDCTPANAVVNSGVANFDSKNNIGPTTTNNLATNSGYFVNHAAANYHLVGGSAPIGAGANLSGAVPTDKDGVTRTNPPDIGAYQYVGSAQIQPPTGLKATVQ